MAKQPSRSSIIASFSPAYLDADKMPWEQVRDQLNLTFNSQQKSEIYACFTEYEAEFAFIELAPTSAAVEKLESDLKSVLEEISSIAESVFAEPESLRIRDYSDDSKAFDFLCLSFSKDYSIREDLHEMYRLAVQIKSSLASESMANRTPVTVAPKTAALAKFIDEALKDGVEKRPARRNPSRSPSFDPIEYSRWNLPIGPKSGTFSVFMSILLNEEITIRMIERAWAHAKDHANDKHPILGR